MCLKDTKPSTVPAIIGYKLVRRVATKVYMGLYCGFFVKEPTYKPNETHISGHFKGGREEIDSYTPGFHVYDSLESVQRLYEIMKPNEGPHSFLVASAPAVIVKVLLEEIHTEGYDVEYQLCYVGNKQTIIEEV